ncbi:MAG TPA: DinB family protein [Vicinamibacteria bacterium]
MRIDEARDLFSYGAWANGRVLAAAEALAPEQRLATAASSFPSVRGTLGHIVGAEWLWLRRWQGESPAAVPAWAAESSLADLRGHLAALEADRDGYLAGLTDADLARLVEYRSLAGTAYADRLGDLFRHLVNHSTYHRGQVATQLRQLGQTPPGTDLITYLRERRQAGR